MTAPIRAPVTVTAVRIGERERSTSILPARRAPAGSIHQATPTLSVGLIGLGTVGGAFAGALEGRRAWIERHAGVRLVLRQVAVAHPDRRRRLDRPVRLHGDADTLARDPDIDLVVEASGATVACRWLRAAHERGAAVVTANKQAVARDHRLLTAIARRDARIRCEAAVAGAVPVVGALRDSLAYDEVEELRAVLNGTTTFILSRLEDGVRYDTALAEARRAGYAEADPSSDLSGEDAAAKLAILCTLAWHEPVGLDRVFTRGLDESIADTVSRARRGGKRVRLIARAWRAGTVHAAVAPIALHEDDVLAATTGVENAIELRAASAGRLLWRGAGAGGLATASALLSDTIAAARALLIERGETSQ